MAPDAPETRIAVLRALARMAYASQEEDQCRERERERERETPLSTTFVLLHTFHFPSTLVYIKAYLSWRVIVFPTLGL